MGIKWPLTSCGFNKILVLTSHQTGSTNQIWCSSKMYFSTYHVYKVFILEIYSMSTSNYLWPLPSFIVFLYSPRKIYIPHMNFNQGVLCYDLPCLPSVQNLTSAWPKLKFWPSQKTIGVLYSIRLIHTPLIWSSSVSYTLWDSVHKQVICTYKIMETTIPLHRYLICLWQEINNWSK